MIFYYHFSDQETNKVMVEMNGSLNEKDDFFIDDWDELKKSIVIHSLRNSVINGGIVIGVYKVNSLLAFACIELPRFGPEQEYVELSYIHVSQKCRGKGIGKMLFEKCCESAIQLGAHKLYIAAHPSIESQNFYKKMKCTLTEYIHEEIFAKEILDIQMERKITHSSK